MKIREIYRLITLKRLKKSAIIRHGNHFYRVLDSAFFCIYLVEPYKPRDYMLSRSEGFLSGFMWPSHIRLDNFLTTTK